MKSAGWAATALAIGCAAGGCARLVGERAAAGAMDSFSEEATTGGGAVGDQVEAAAGRAVEGATGRLSDPDQIRILRRLVAEAASEAARSFTASVRDAVATAAGPDGTALSARLTSATENIAAAAADGARRGAMPACASDDPGCVDRRIAELSQSAATGFMRGVRRSLDAAALTLGFLAGAMTMLLAGLVANAWRRPGGALRRADSRTRAGSPGTSAPT